MFTVDSMRELDKDTQYDIFGYSHLGLATLEDIKKVNSKEVATFKFSDGFETNMYEEDFEHGVVMAVVRKAD